MSESEIDQERLWKQLLARAWIDSRQVKSVIAAYCGILTVDFSDAVPEFYPPDQRLWSAEPVRALFARAWPKLSRWLWAQDLRKWELSALEDKIIAALEIRKFPKLKANRYTARATNAAFYGKKKATAHTLGEAIGKVHRQYQSDWHATKQTGKSARPRMR